MAIPRNTAALMARLSALSRTIDQIGKDVEEILPDWDSDQMADELPTLIAVAIRAHGVPTDYAERLADEISVNFRLVRRRLLSMAESVRHIDQAQDAATEALHQATVAAATATEETFKIQETPTWCGSTSPGSRPGWSRRPICSANSPARSTRTAVVPACR